MFQNRLEQDTYIQENFTDVTDSRIDNGHWTLPCSNCKTNMGFQVTKKEYMVENGTYMAPIQWTGTKTLHFRCPACQTYKLWIVYLLGSKYYRVAALPAEGVNEIDELPLEPLALRAAYKEAIKCWNADSAIGAAAMFRRATQVITRDVLGANPGNLANELKEVVGKTYNGITVSGDFEKWGYIIKESGNQAAHPDQDPDLMTFTRQDAEDLHGIFMELVGMLWIIPKAKEKALKDFMERRKIPKPKAKSAPAQP